MFLESLKKAYLAKNRLFGPQKALERAYFAEKKALNLPVYL